MRRRPLTSTRPETQAMAREWQRTKRRYLRSGLCHKCAAQFLGASEVRGMACHPRQDVERPHGAILALTSLRNFMDECIRDICISITQRFRDKAENLMVQFVIQEPCLILQPVSRMRQHRVGGSIHELQAGAAARRPLPPIHPVAHTLDCCRGRGALLRSRVPRR